MAVAPLFGLLNLFKPSGWSSRDVVNRVERIVKPAKAGHAGTLDPLAEGVLVVGVGGATRLTAFVQDSAKVYQARFQLGRTSDTDDSTGQVTISDVPQPPTLDQIHALIPEFTGTIWQTPPQYSAVHVDGQRAYALARQGATVEIAPRQVRVDRLEIVRYDWPDLEVCVECGSGTYIRSIGRDMGEKLGCGGLMTALVRTRIGPFLAESAVSIGELSKDNIREHLQPAIRAVEAWPQHRCTSDELLSLTQGRMIEFPLELAEGTRCAVLTPNGDLAALGEIKSLRRMAPTHVFVDRLGQPR
jgi:tRNA pseudouridine55 synthase